MNKKQKNLVLNPEQCGKVFNFMTTVSVGLGLGKFLTGGALVMGANFVDKPISTAIVGAGLALMCSAISNIVLGGTIYNKMLKLTNEVETKEKRR